MSKLALSALLLLTALVSAAAPVAAATHAMDFEEALQRASERDVPLVVDFFTDWCVYCKHFDRDLADAESGLKSALDAVVFTSVDAEKGAGVALAEKYGVTGFPTYIVVNASGEMLDRWSGYGGPEHFLGYLEPALADPTTVAQKQARFEKSPTADDAQKLAEFAVADGAFLRARELYRQAEALDPARDLSQDIVYSGYFQWREDDEFAGADFVELVSETLDTDSPAGPWMLAVNLAQRIRTKEETPELLLPVLKGALAARQAQPDFDEKVSTRLEVLSLLHLQEKGDEAAQLQKSTLKEGWQDDASGLNSYAWWCFENKVNLVEAEQLARRGVELAESGPDKAMILDTAAEICNALGNCRDAVTLMEMAIAEDPDQESYQKQLERFQKIVASSE